MKELNTFIYYFLLLCVAVCGILIVAPKGKLEKYIKFLASLVIIFALFNPLKSLLNLLFTFAETAENNVMAYTDISDSQDSNDSRDGFVCLCETYICRDIESIISENFGIDQCKVELQLDTSDYLNVHIKKINIKIDSETDCDKDTIIRIEEYIRKIMLCETEILRENEGTNEIG